MVRIRLMRVGKRKQPSYRVVVADSRSPRDGRIIEAIGRYQPRTEPSEVVIDTDRARYWLDRGAQPSEQVRRLLDIAIEGKVAPEPKPKVKATRAASVDETETEEAPETEAAPAEVPEAVDQAPAAPEAETAAAPEAEEEQPKS
ncbi:MAG: 30S ribosomal protein S16 [Actinomycetota bacterium]